MTSVKLLFASQRSSSIPLFPFLSFSLIFFYSLEVRSIFLKKEMRWSAGHELIRGIRKSLWMFHVHLGWFACVWVHVCMSGGHVHTCMHTCMCLKCWESRGRTCHVGQSPGAGMFWVGESPCCKLLMQQDREGGIAWPPAVPDSGKVNIQHLCTCSPDGEGRKSHYRVTGDTKPKPTSATQPTAGD